MVVRRMPLVVWQTPQLFLPVKLSEFRAPLFFFLPGQRPFKAGNVPACDQLVRIGIGDLVLVTYLDYGRLARIARNDVLGVVLIKDSEDLRSGLVINTPQRLQ